MNREHQKRIILIFVDGLGIGERDSQKNPCTHSSLTLFHHFIDESFPKSTDQNGKVVALDATLGVPGLPQSATGQTALLTGINASQQIGKHLSGFPNKKLRQLLSEEGLFKQMTLCDKVPAFINTFRPPFFDYNPFEIERFLSTTTLVNLYAGMPFFSLDDLRDERSIYHDLTNETLLEKGFEVPKFTPAQAGRILAKQSENYDIVLYEYFQTDQAGHSQNRDFAHQKLKNLHEFVLSLLEHIDAAETVVVMVSDHGNIEDLSRKSHSMNPALTMIVGRDSKDFSRLQSLTDVTPFLLHTLLNCSAV